MFDPRSVIVDSTIIRNEMCEEMQRELLERRNAAPSSEEQVDEVLTFAPRSNILKRLLEATK